MNIEKMLELLLLGNVLNDFFYDRRTNVIKWDGEEYEYDKIYNAYKVLMKEFLSPYVINKDSKE